MNKKQALGMIGAATLAFGVFAPFVSVPFLGSTNYFQNGKGDGTLVLALAVLAFVFVLINAYKWLWVMGAASLAVLLFTFVNFQTKMSSMKADMARELAGNPFGEIANAALQSVQLQWGWPLLVIGSCFLIASSVIKEGAVPEASE